MLLKPFEKLEFTDDYMFKKVMKNEEICKGVIERLLQKFRLMTKALK